ncbi:MAG: histidine--tRNA ligase [Janthinobacterium lividum]
MFQPVRGTHDVYGPACQKYLKTVDTARHITELYGYEEIITPIFEFSQVFHRLGETSDVVSKETYNLTDRGGDELTLRPEGTAPVVRAAIFNGLTQNLPLRFFYAGPMFRYERPQKGRYRQFDQIGAELCGVQHPQADIEVISMASHVLKSLQVTKGITLEINTLGDTESRVSYRQALIDYFTRYQSSLSADSQKRLLLNPLRLLDSKDPKDQEIAQDAPLYDAHLTSGSSTYFEAVLKGLDVLGIAYHINRKLVRGLDYYGHTAFEIISDALGTQGTVLAGGRYDGLFKAMGGPDIGGVGWAGGIQRLMSLSPLILENRPDLCLIALGEEAEASCLSLAQELRHHHFKTQLNFSGNLSKKMKYAHKIAARWAIVVGEDELKNNTVVVRNLDQGSQTTLSRLQLVDYLKAQGNV